MPLKLHIRDIRKAQRLTLEVVADRVGISVPHLSEVERGVKNVNNHLLERISAALGVRPDDLVSGDDGTPKDESRDRLQKAIHGMQEADSFAKVAEYAEMLLQLEQSSKRS